MKKILITGASGTIGETLIKYFLSEGKYKIIALDLKSGKTNNLFKKYKRRIKTVIGDVTDRNLIEKLIKDVNYVIHLAGVTPPFSEINKELGELIDYNSTEIISRAINYYNPKCHLIYISTTSIYMDNCNARVKSKANGKSSLFNNTKLKCEKHIKNKMKNYTIVRAPLVLTYIKNESFIYNVKNDEISAITKKDLASLFVNLINKIDKFNKKTINISGNETFNVNYKDLEKKILLNYGLSVRYLFSKIFIEKNYYSPQCKDVSKTEAILKYQIDNLDNYLNELKQKNKNKKLRLLFSKIYVRLFFK